MTEGGGITKADVQTNDRNRANIMELYCISMIRSHVQQRDPSPPQTMNASTASDEKQDLFLRFFAQIWIKAARSVQQTKQ